ncbi:MAG: methyltransferase domain-containing protein [Acetobacteraceae bacterium]
MAEHAEMGLTTRLLAVWDHLGLRRAHVATQVPADIAGLIAVEPDRIGGLVLCVPARMDPAGFAGVSGRMLMIAGDRGLTADLAARAVARLPGAGHLTLQAYDASGWSDVVADRTDTIMQALRTFLPAHAATELDSAPRAGSHAGISYRVQGRGPALVLMPFFLAPSQWEPAIGRLAQDFTVVALGGRHLGGIAALEDRARSDTYRALVCNLLRVIAPANGESILDVGCGSGALDRMLARTVAQGCRIIATDLNPFLLREAAALAAEDGLADDIQFQQANAESLPFPDDSFDHAFTITVLEECDADRAMAELRRVVRPGGRVGVIVRAIDMPQWWHLSLPDALRRKTETPPQSVGAKGVADASLYRRMRAAGFTDLTCFPSLVTFDRPGGPIWGYREDYVLSLLTPEETAVWRDATEAAHRNGLLFMANPLHCVVGRKRV